MIYRFEIFLPSVLSYLFNYDPAAVVHEFSIDLSGKHMPTKSYQKYGRSGRTDAFFGVDIVRA